MYICVNNKKGVGYNVGMVSASIKLVSCIGWSPIASTNLNVMAYDIENTFKQILLYIEEGGSLRSTLKREGMPTSTTFYEWIDNDKEKTLHYARACEKRADKLFEDILEIAYNIEEGVTTKETEKGIEVTTGDMLGHRKLKIDSIKWMLGKMNHKKYGEKIQQEHSGEVTTNIISLGNGTKPE